MEISHCKVNMMLRPVAKENFQCSVLYCTVYKMTDLLISMDQQQCQFRFYQDMACYHQAQGGCPSPVLKVRTVFYHTILFFVFGHHPLCYQVSVLRVSDSVEVY